MRKIFVCALLCAVIGSTIGLVASIGQSTDPTNPYYTRTEPSYLDVVKARIALHSAEYKAIRKNVIDRADLQVLEIWLSEGAMYAIYSALPISNWQALYDITYKAKATSNPRRAVSQNVALELLFLFDLPMGNAANVWPWS